MNPNITPAQLQPSAFAGYAPLARKFATQYLNLLRRLPLSICPSFLKQIQDLDTSFPAERSSLLWQCNSLEALPAAQLDQLLAPLATITLSPALQSSDWVHAPAPFIAQLTAHLWSTGQLDAFRAATRALFAAIPPQQNTAHRLAFIVLSRDLQPPPGPVLRKLAKHGTLLTSLNHDTARDDLWQLATAHAAASTSPYAHWYIDGGDPWPIAPPAHFTSVAYPSLDPLRRRVLERMESTLVTPGGGPEQMRDRLAAVSPTELGSALPTSDPVLARFYTELFTQSSGPQIFSTSFVQWAGRELARRAQPETVVLRYALRQAHRDLNQMFSDDAKPGLDPAGSFRDAEMGAYYNWLEMRRVAATGKLTFVALIEAQSEAQPTAVILSPNAPAGSTCTTPLSLRQALQNFG